jgi:hypothetical protein
MLSRQAARHTYWILLLPLAEVFAQSKTASAIAAGAVSRLGFVHSVAPAAASKRIRVSCLTV